MSGFENVDSMLGRYSRDDERNNQTEDELNLDSGSNRPQQNSNLVGDVFRSLLNTNSIKKSEMTIQTSRMIRDGIANQVTKKLNDIMTSLNSKV